jgi:hypothetical protein
VKGEGINLKTEFFERHFADALIEGVVFDDEQFG